MSERYVDFEQLLSFERRFIERTQAIQFLAGELSAQVQSAGTMLQDTVSAKIMTEIVRLSENLKKTGAAAEEAMRQNQRRTQEEIHEFEQL